MSASTATPLNTKQQDNFIQYYKTLQENTSTNRESNRQKYLGIDKSYQRETDLEQEHVRAKASNKKGGTSRYQNQTVPVVMPQVETAAQYQTSVFLTGHPLFGVVAAPKFMDEAMQLETVIEDQAEQGGWTRHLMKFFRDGFKYNLSAVEVAWETKVTMDLTTDIANSAKEATPKKVQWSGNSVKRLDPYNLILDSRVPPVDIPTRGEFVGYTELVTRTELKSYINELPDKIVGNITEALESNCTFGTESNTGYEGVFLPDINPFDASDDHQQGTDWNSWAGLAKAEGGIDYKDIYERTILYCRVIPSNFGLKIPASNTPQIFKLVIINHKHIIYAERQTNAHSLLPILIGQPHEDGLGYQTKSLATNAEGFQEVATAFMNSIVHSRRRAISDRVLYDPSRVSEAAINNPNASAKIPVRPAAYGKNVGDAVYQFPYREDQAQLSMQQISAVVGMSNQVAGQNQASQGQFVKGNRTLQEYDDVMQNASGRDQMVSILYETQIFQPMKTILKTNILQYQGGTEIYNRDKDRIVEVDPVKLRKAVLNFKISDGLTPSSKIINADTLKSALQTIATSPQIGSAYNIGPMFSYLMKTQGAEIGEFEKSAEQQAYEQAVSTWQNTIMQVMEKNPDQDPEKLPPQPLPEQFNYDPSGKEPL